MATPVKNHSRRSAAVRAVAVSGLLAGLPPLAAQGSALIRNINEQSTGLGSNPTEVVPFNGGALILATRADVGDELFFAPSAGTAMLVADIRPGAPGSGSAGGRAPSGAAPGASAQSG